MATNETINANTPTFVKGSTAEATKEETIETEAFNVTNTGSRSPSTEKAETTLTEAFRGEKTTDSVAVNASKTSSRIPAAETVSTEASANVTSNGSINIMDKSVILSFVTIHYATYIDSWYNQLSSLGYTEHVVAAWDEATLEYCNTRNFRAFPCFLDNKTRTTPEDPNQRLRRRLFAHRWKCVRQQLQNGVNVLLTDVDNVFVRYVPLREFDQWNVIHAYGGGYPPRFFKQHGFTVCGGMSWLQARPETIRYVDLILQRCKSACDDQGAVNHLFSVLNISWSLEEPLQSLQQQQHNWPEPVGSRHGVSKLTNHTVKIWDPSFAYRGFVEARPCPELAWVTMPYTENSLKRHHEWFNFCPTQNQTFVGMVSATKA